MGLQRGPLRTPGSVRDLKENDGNQTQHDSPERPECPRWLKGRARAIFDELVDKIVAANVPTKTCDSEMVALTAQTALDYRNAKDSAMRARIGRDLEKYYAVIGLHMASRLRLGIKSAPRGTSKTKQLLAMVAPKVGEAKV